MNSINQAETTHPNIRQKRPTFEIGPKWPAPTGPKRLASEIGSNWPRPKQPGIGPKQPRFAYRYLCIYMPMSSNKWTSVETITSRNYIYQDSRYNWCHQISFLPKFNAIASRKLTVVQETRHFLFMLTPSFSRCTSGDDFFCCRGYSWSMTALGGKRK